MDYLRLTLPDDKKTISAIPTSRSLIRKLFQEANVEASDVSLLKYLHVLHLVARVPATPLFGLTRRRRRRRRRREEERTRNGWRELGFPWDMWPAFLDGVSIRCQSTAAANFLVKLPTFNAFHAMRDISFPEKGAKSRNAYGRFSHIATISIDGAAGSMNPDLSSELLTSEIWLKKNLFSSNEGKKLTNQWISKIYTVYLRNSLFVE